MITDDDVRALSTCLRELVGAHPEFSLFTAGGTSIRLPGTPGTALSDKKSSREQLPRNVPWGSPRIDAPREPQDPLSRKSGSETSSLKRTKQLDSSDDGDEKQKDFLISAKPVSVPGRLFSERTSTDGFDALLRSSEETPGQDAFQGYLRSNASSPGTELQELGERAEHLREKVLAWIPSNSADDGGGADLGPRRKVERRQPKETQNLSPENEANVSTGGATWHTPG